MRRPRLLAKASGVLRVAVLGVLAQAASSATAQVSAPPRALPVSSAYKEDAKAGDAAFYNLRAKAAVQSDVAEKVLNRPQTLSLAPVEVTPKFVSTNPPSEAAQELVPLPPYATPQPSGPTLLVEPPEAPLISLRPTYVPPGAKQGILQQSLGRFTYLPRIGDDGFGLTTLSQQFTFALPPFISGSPILVTPVVATHFTDGPGPTPVPPQLRDYEIEFRWMKQVTPRLGVDLAVAPSYFGDGENDSSDAWRVTGRALGAWNWTETVQVVFGGLYLGRSDWPAVPVGGIIWKPSPDYRFDILLPRPRAYYRIYGCGANEQWIYLGGEFGGNTWAVERPGQVRDKLTYSDLRVVAGWENKYEGGLNLRGEIGWVFDRSIEFVSGFPGFDPSDTLMVRGEMSF